LVYSGLFEVLYEYWNCFLYWHRKDHFLYYRKFNDTKFSNPTTQMSSNLFVSALPLAMFCNFHCTSILPYWLSLFLSVLFHFIFDVIANEIIFLISFLDCSLSMYRNTTNFSLLISYLSTLLKFISFCRLFRVFTYKIMSSLNRNDFTFNFLIHVSFIYFSCLIALASTSSATE
jgi:hypothetical protein